MQSLQLAPGALLAQISGDLTTATSAFSPKGANAEIHFITVQVDQNCDCTIYHDDDGTTYALASQIWKESRTTALNNTPVFADVYPRIYVSKQGAIGVQCSVASAATFSFYGVRGESRG